MLSAGFSTDMFPRDLIIIFVTLYNIRICDGAKTCGGCHTGWNYFANNNTNVCWKSFKHRKTFTEAVHECINHRAFLPMPEEGVENDDLLQILNQEDSSYPTWLGFSDNETEGNWTYVAGDKLGQQMEWNNWYIPDQDSSCERPLDIQFLLDGSSSMGSEGWKAQIEFIGKFATRYKIGLNHVQIGVTQFSATASTSSPRGFPLNQHTDMNSFVQNVKRLSWFKSSTLTHLGLIEIMDNAFTDEYGGRPEAPNVLVVITDGESAAEKQLQYEAARLHRMSKDGPIRVFAIGSRPDAKLKTLRTIASSNENVFQVGSPAELLDQATIIQTWLCSEPDFDLVKNCAIMDERGKWADGDCDIMSGFICMYSQNNSAEASSRHFSTVCDDDKDNILAVTAVIISPIVVVVACGICILFFVFCRRRRKDERDDTGNYAADDAEQVKEKGEPVSWIGYINDTGIKEVG